MYYGIHTHIYLYTYVFIVWYRVYGIAYMVYGMWYIVLKVQASYNQAKNVVANRLATLSLGYAYSYGFVITTLGLQINPDRNLIVHVHLCMWAGNLAAEKSIQVCRLRSIDR